MDTLKILLVEDQQGDADLVLHALRSLRKAIEHRRVTSEQALVRELAEFRPEIVLSDFSMPGFSGIEALRVVTTVSRDTPFIFVSGTIGEELAIEALQRGAIDYVLKDNLKRLAPSVERALRIASDRDERRRMERALFESEARYRSIVEATQDWIWETDADGIYTYTNHSVQTILGYGMRDILGTEDTALLCEQDRADIEQALAEHREEKRGWHDWLLRYRHRDGSVRIVESTAHPLFDNAGELVGYRGIDRDVTERIANETKLRQLSRIHAVLSALGSALLAARDSDEILADVVRLAVEQGSFASALIIEGIDGNGPTMVSHHHGDTMLRDRTSSVLGAPANDEFEAMRHSLRSGNIVFVRDIATFRETMPLALRPGEREDHRSMIALPFGQGPSGVLLLHSRESHQFDVEEMALLERLAKDITRALDFIAKTERLEYMARYHELTGLPNRALFREQVAERHARDGIAVGLVDVAGLHRFQDSRGHEFSMTLLHEIAQRLRAQLDTDVILAHLSDNTFGVAFNTGVSLEEATLRLDSLLERAAAVPYDVEGEHVHVALHCGLLDTGRHDGGQDQIERNAHAALTEARQRHARVTVYNEAFSQRAQRRLSLEEDLRKALAEQQLEIFLQPKFDVRSRQLTGAEALLRWRHPVEGLMSPAEFVPILEETGLILPVGRWIMRTALAMTERWRHAGHGQLRIAINVSARELRHEGFVETARKLLSAYPSDHGLDIEITEGLLMEDMERSIALLDELRRLGCLVHIDDFGTGYSSLHYLSRLPVDVLKIDQSFIAGIAQSPQSHALVSNTIGLAHALGLRVVAEGVEDAEQAKLLTLLRCDELQGFHLGRPVPAETFDEAFLRRT
ncbi:EAL domain-containing protein [Dokdonella sp. MW10]|uniref:sensor domain-containing protein n=1 Tax=Dokdonella sp. MW10 TaxID=2992926 RepID=UPI003F7FE293